MSLKIQKMLVSQPAPATGKSPYYTLGERYNFSVDFKPFFSIQTIGTREFRDYKIDLSAHTAIILSSRTAIDHFFSLCKGLRHSMPADMKYFCSSFAVASYLQKYIVYRKRKIFYAENGKKEELHSLLLKHPKEQYLIPGMEGLREDLLPVLKSKKIKHTPFVLYRSVPNTFSVEEIKAYDLLVFFSPNGAHSLKINAANYEQGEQLIACYGEPTAKALRDMGLEVNIFAPMPECPSMPAALEHFFSQD